MPMYDPPHPGESIFLLCLEPLDLSVAEPPRTWKSTKTYLASAL